MPHRRSLVRFLYLAPLFLFGLSALAQRGAIVKPQNLAEVTAQAATIVHGTITSVQVEPHPQFSHLRTVVVTVAVSDTLKGQAADSVSFRQYLWDPRDVRERAGYRPRQEVVLFLNAPSEIGLTSPVGIHQGRFQVELDNTGTKMAVNTHSNVTLMKGVSQLSSTSKLSARTRKALVMSEATGGELTLDALKETVRALVAAGRTN